ncbi:MAG: alkaline phosphatase family protein [bacterium]
MKKPHVALFIFIDAFGWEVYQRNRFFLDGMVKDSKRLESILGYSSACDPSIISGLLPSEHRMWSSFYYSPKTCPYRWLRHLRWLPDSIFSRGRVRYWMSRWIKKLHGFTGYFMIYSVPFKVLPFFDYCEKRSIWREGLVRGKTIFNQLDERRIPYYVHQSATSDEARFTALRGDLNRGAIDFAYVSLGRLDALMHKVGNAGPQVTELLRWYDRQVRDTIAAAEAVYEDVSWYVFTDHGMHNTTSGYDLIADVQKLGLVYGRDYVAFYDATMGRFWALNDNARVTLTGFLSSHSKGRVLSDDELRDLGVYFEDHMYGDIVFLMNSPIQIVPSFMGGTRMPGIHGFHPRDPDSCATILSNRALPESLKQIHEIYQLMLREVPELSGKPAAAVGASVR